jgi:pimeloyl-ACP methyl ester carboxylesterase
VPLHVTETGDPEGPLVVFVHGTMDRGASFAHLARRLRDLRCVRYDRRGYGRSRATGPPAGVQEHVDDLLQVLGERPAVVVGHSFGGTVALTAACRRPDLVRALLVYEAAMSWLPWWPGSSAGSTALSTSTGDPGDAAEAFLRRMIGDRWDTLPARTRADRRAEGPALLGELRSIRQEGPPCDLEAVTAPTVVVRGSRSPEHLRRGAAHLAEVLAHAELVECGGAGHGGHQSHPDFLAEQVRRLVEP